MKTYNNFLTEKIQYNLTPPFDLTDWDIDMLTQIFDATRFVNSDIYGAKFFNSGYKGMSFMKVKEGEIEEFLIFFESSDRIRFKKNNSDMKEDFMFNQNPKAIGIMIRTYYDDYILQHNLNKYNI